MKHRFTIKKKLKVSKIGNFYPWGKGDRGLKIGKGGNFDKF